MARIADYFKNIQGEEDTETHPSAVQDDTSEYIHGDNNASQKKPQINLQKTGNISTAWIASKNRRKFHRRDCEWAAYILKSENLVTFSSYQEAMQAGYKPCRTCINAKEAGQKSI